MIHQVLFTVENAEGHRLQLKSEMVEQLGMLKRNLNVDKIFIRKLEPEGDALHVLGPIIVKRSIGVNRIKRRNRMLSKRYWLTQPKAPCIWILMLMSLDG